MNKIKKFIAAGLAIVLALSAAACGSGGTETESGVEPETEGLVYIKEMSELERGNFYLETEDGYVQAIWPDASFTTNVVNTAPDTSRVVWYNDKTWENIPTLYKNGNIVFRTNQEFSETFYFEKFLDNGYTFGICGMQETETGRYKVNTDEKSNTLNPSSTAADLLKYGDINVVIDAIDGKPLRAGQVSKSGVITGLAKDRDYKIQLYVGTEIQEQTLTADSRALTSAQINSTTEYEYVEAEIIKIPIPDYFVSGYYSINGMGLFRYVDGETYDDGTDFNALNVNETGVEGKEIINSDSESRITVTENVEIEFTSNYEITIEYDNNISTELLPAGKDETNAPVPNAYLNPGSLDVVKFEKAGDNVLKARAELAAGTYPVEIRYIYGRNYTLTVAEVDSLEIETEPALEGENAEVPSESVAEGEVPAETVPGAEPAEEVPANEGN